MCPSWCSPPLFIDRVCGCGGWRLGSHPPAAGSLQSRSQLPSIWLWQHSSSSHPHFLLWQTMVSSWNPYFQHGSSLPGNPRIKKKVSYLFKANLNNHFIYPFKPLKAEPKIKYVFICLYLCLTFILKYLDICVHYDIIHQINAKNLIVGRGFDKPPYNPSSWWSSHCVMVDISYNVCLSSHFLIMLALPWENVICQKRSKFIANYRKFIYL